MKTTGGLFAQIKKQSEQIFADAGKILNDAIVRPLGEKVLPWLQKAAGWFSSFAETGEGEFISETPSSYQKFAEEHGYIEQEQSKEGLAAAQKKQEEAAAQKKQEEAAARAARFRQERAKQRNARNQEQWESMDLGEKRELIGRNTKLGQDVTSEELKEKLRSHPVFAKLAADETITAEDEQNYNMLSVQLEQLKILEKQEAAVAHQRKNVEQITQDYENRKELLQAELAGDEEKVRQLQAEEEIRKRIEGYEAKGVDAETAKKMVEEEVKLEADVTKKKAAQQEAQQAAQPQLQPPANGWIQTSLASVGGGGVRIRQYESAGLKSAQNTEKNTAAMVTKMNDLVIAVKNLKTSNAMVLP